MRPVARRHIRRGMTLVELLIALAVSALICAAAVAMFSATAYGTSSSQAMADVLVKAHVVNARLSAAIRNAAEVTAADTDYIVLWVADANADEARQYGEMQLIERDPTDHVLRSYRDDMDTTNFTTAAAFRSTAKASYTPQAWATKLSSVAFTTDVNPPNTKLVNYRITVQDDLVDEVSVGATALRNQ